MEAIHIDALTLEEFVERYNENPFELVDGECIPMAPQITRSATTGGRTYFRVSLFLQENPIGEVFIEAPFVLKLEEGSWVRGSRTPDVMFYNAQRLAQIMTDPDWEDKPLIGPPDLAVEIISPTDKFSDVTRKALDYLRDGVLLVWVIDPKAKMVTIFRANQSEQTLLQGEEAILSGESVLPGFQIALKELWGA